MPLPFALLLLATESVRLSLDVPVTLELRAGETLDAVFVPEIEGAYTVLVESLEADPLVRLLDAAGAVLGEEDGGGIEWNARLYVERAAGEALPVRALFLAQGAGRLTLEVRAGHAQPPPSGSPARLAQRGAFFEGRAQADAARRTEFLSLAANFYYDAGEYPFSRRAADRLVSLAGERGEDERELIGLAFRGACAVRVDDIGGARADLTRARELADTVDNASLRLFVARQLGDLALASEDGTAAQMEYDAVLELARDMGDARIEGIACSQLGRARQLLDDPEGARSWHARALELARTSGDAERQALALLALSRFHEDRGEAGRARDALVEVLDLSRDPLRRADAIGRLGQVELELGDPIEALRRFEETLALGRAAGHANLQALALAGLGRTHNALGDFARALELLDEAVELLGSSGTPADRAAVASLRAESLRSLGRDVEARAGEEALLEIALEASNRRAESLARIGLSLSATNPAEAREHARLAERAAREAHDDELAGLALGQLAYASLLGGDAGEAVNAARAAVEMHLGRGQPLAALPPLSTLAEAALDRGDAEEASRLLDQVESLLVLGVVRGLSIEQGSTLRARRQVEVWGRVAQDVAGLGGMPAADGLRSAGLWKGRALLEGIASRRLGHDPEAVALHDESRSVAADHEAMTRAIATAVRDGAALEEVEAFRARADALAARLAEIPARLAAADPREALADASSDVQTDELLERVLGGQGVLVEYAEGRSRLYGYALTAQGAHMADLGERDALEALVQTYVDGMSDTAHLADAETVAATGRELYERLLAPLLPRGTPPDTSLVVVPTAGLARLPFEALVVSVPEQATSFAEITFVIDRFRVSYGPSSPVLAALANAPPRRGGDDVLVLADPLTPDESGATAHMRGGRWPRLPGTRHEALTIADLLADPSAEDDLRRIADERSATLRLGSFELRLGADVDEIGLRGDLSAVRVLHFATHGSVDPSDPLRTGLLLSPAGTAADGFLSTTEVLELDLDADLVVLSACETARGPVRAGEGVQSLAWAFLYAGARSVVASLWPVDDVATSQLMADFHGRRVGGASVVEALHAARMAARLGGRAAGLATRGQPLGGSRPQAAWRGHPHAWAPFIPIGAVR